MPKKKEVGKKQPELHEVIAALDKYKERLYESDKIGSMKFMHMQDCLHWTKQIIRDLYGAERETGAVAWIK